MTDSFMVAASGIAAAWARPETALALISAMPPEAPRKFRREIVMMVSLFRSVPAFGGRGYDGALGRTG
ncbi:hypothetical protein XFLAVUS301_32620 [Xanthobacter flavus]|uniref:Uncharacterized protein n=1 Tax=Xanthobacter flavus TaxID=281 RepID=A0A9W6CTI0_XANFL|nr:hypothetical protein XFLAVUS301_32620 [Xanthobacter flavus]